MTTTSTTTTTIMIIGVTHSHTNETICIQQYSNNNNNMCEMSCATTTTTTPPTTTTTMVVLCSALCDDHHDEHNKTWNDRYWSVAKELEHNQFTVSTEPGNTTAKYYCTWTETNLRNKQKKKIATNLRRVFLVWLIKQIINNTIANNNNYYSIGSKFVKCITRTCLRKK